MPRFSVGLTPLCGVRPTLPGPSRTPFHSPIRRFYHGDHWPGRNPTEDRAGRNRCRAVTHVAALFRRAETSRSRPDRGGRCSRPTRWTPCSATAGCHGPSDPLTATACRGPGWHWVVLFPAAWSQTQPVSAARPSLSRAGRRGRCFRAGWWTPSSAAQRCPGRSGPWTAPAIRPWGRRGRCGRRGERPDAEPGSGAMREANGGSSP